MSKHVVAMTSEVLEQVANDILPQAEFQQQEALRKFRSEIEK